MLANMKSIQTIVQSAECLGCDPLSKSEPEIPRSGSMHSIDGKSGSMTIYYDDSTGKHLAIFETSDCRNNLAQPLSQSLPLPGKACADCANPSVSWFAECSASGGCSVHLGRKT